jgi:hypothetical protein
MNGPTKEERIEQEKAKELCGHGAALSCILELGHNFDHTNGPCHWANLECKDYRRFATEPIPAP